MRIKIPGQGVYCTPKDTWVAGSIDDKNPSDPKHNCSATISVNPASDLPIGGGVAKATTGPFNVLLVNTGAPIGPEQIVIHNANPSEGVCSHDHLESPQAGDDYSIDKPTEEPMPCTCYVSNEWKYTDPLARSAQASVRHLRQPAYGAARPDRARERCNARPAALCGAPRLGVRVGGVLGVLARDVDGVSRGLDR